GRAQLELAEKARRRHAYVDAELAYSAALPHLDGDQERMTALAGRASVRYQIHRLDDALADATAARELAESMARHRETVELLLLEAMILDWQFDTGAAEERTSRARALVAGMDDLEGALLAAEGRAAFRRDDLTGAADLFARAVELGDYQTRIIALLVYAPILTFLERLAEAEVRFEQAVALCQEVGDDFHLAVALSNRTPLWARLGRLERARDDLGRAVLLARRLGNAVVERSASLNLAELLYHAGAYEEALPLALRARDLQARFIGEDELPDTA